MWRALLGKLLEQFNLWSYWWNMHWRLSSWIRGKTVHFLYDSLFFLLFSIFMSFSFSCIFFYFIACTDGYYGINCSGVCPSHCRTCNPTDGTCGCYAGWTGPNCSFGICLIYIFVIVQQLTIYTANNYYLFLYVKILVNYLPL